MTMPPLATGQFAKPVREDEPARTGELALALQEAFTVAVRLRASRQAASDAVSFRAHVKTLLAAADRDARSRGYDPEYVKLAVYAYTAFLDETVLHSNAAMFAEWTRQPLQEEIFGEHMAGENFFRYLLDLLGRQDSSDLADLLEVYLLCLQLGFHGKYAAGDPGSLQGLVLSMQQKIQRIRGARGPATPLWALPRDEVVDAGTDPWMRRIGRVAAGALIAAAVLFLVFWLVLRSGAGSIRELARPLSG